MNSVKRVGQPQPMYGQTPAPGCEPDARLDKLSSNHPPGMVIQVVDLGVLVDNSWRLLPVVGVTAAETARRADPR